MENFNPFNFTGRIGRLQYFGFGIIWLIILWFAIIFLGAFSNASGTSGAFGYVALMILYAIATFSYGIRRLHDFDKSGWWYVLMFIPFANFVMGIVLLVAPGTQGSNTYGVRVR